MKKRIIAASALALAITVGGSALLSGNAKRGFELNLLCTEQSLQLTEWQKEKV